MPETVKLWEGSFGTEYTKRNKWMYRKRKRFWEDIFSRYLYSDSKVLEVGCNRGENLKSLRKVDRYIELYGCDVNQYALSRARRIKGVITVEADASELPYPDHCFDMVFTCGLLIHLDLGQLHETLYEIDRVSKKYVILMEYWGKDEIVQYRGHDNALFKRRYGEIFKAKYPHYREERVGFLDPGDGFDNLTFWVFQK